MPQKIHTITLPLPLGMGSVNCYLLETAGGGWVLIDTGPASARPALERELERAGCAAGSLRLVLLTHGDFDHTGSAAHLRARHGVKIAMHAGDSLMLERGDMFYNRKQGSRLLRAAAPVLFGFGKANRCAPDLLLEDGASLAEFGLEAAVVHIPGHSLGSIGVLAEDGSLFCGDLLENVKSPALNSIMDDLAAARASIEKLARLRPGTIYPGHGSAFPYSRLDLPF